jgi:hypothetical protein
MKYAVHTDQGDTTLILENGGIATFHNNGEHLVATYYQGRPEMFTFDYKMWNNLDEDKVYLHDWHTKQHFDGEALIDALKWMCMFCDTFDETDFQTLVDEYNNKFINS